MKTQTSKTRGAVIYTRVSTGEQARHGTSPESQLEMCRAKAAALALPIVAEIYDPAITGGYFLFRPGIQQALSLISGGQADTLIFTSSSRMTRDREHLEIIKRTVREAGGRLVFCDMDYTDTSASNLQLNVKNDFEVYEKQLFRERSMTGKKTRAGGGIQPARASSPFGYHVPTKADIMHGLYPLEMLGRYVIVPEEAALVQRIFEGYAAGSHSMHRLCWELNREGVPTAKGASAWRPAAIKAILANPVHKGSPAYGKVEHRKTEARLSQTNPLSGRPYICDIARTRVDADEWITMTAPAIVTEEVWQQAQERSAVNKAHKGGRPASVRMLSGRAVCPVCGGGMAFLQQKKDQWHKYQCHRHVEGQRAKMPAVCDGTSYPVQTTEQAVVLSVMEAAQQPDSFWAHLVAATEQSQPPNLEQARREMTALDKALAELADDDLIAVQAQMAGLKVGASPLAYAAVFADLAARRKDMESRRGTLRLILSSQPIDSRPKSYEAAGDNPALRQQMLDAAWPVLTSPDVPGARKREILGALVDKVICRKGGAEVVYLPGVLGEGFAGSSDSTVQSMSIHCTVKDGQCHWSASS